MSLALIQQIETLKEKKQTAAVKKQIKALQDQVDAASAAAASVVAEQERVAEVQATKQAKKYGGAAAAGAGAEAAADAPEPGRTLPCKDCTGSFFFSDSVAAYYAKWEMVDPVRCAPCRAAKKAAQPQPLELECNDCGDHFLHSVAAQKHYEMSGYDAPIRCLPCREHKKANKAPVNPPQTHIKCGDCTKFFEFTKSQRVHFEAQGWAPPTRCLPCRTAKKAAPRPQQAAQSINCGDCKKDFSFPVGSQKHFKAQGWAAPTRCGDCRLAKKAKVAAEVKAKEEMSETAKDQAAELAALDAAEAMDASKASSAAKMASNIGNVGDLLDAALVAVGLPTGIVLRPSDSDEKGASV